METDVDFILVRVRIGRGGSDMASNDSEMSLFVGPSPLALASPNNPR